MAKQNIITTVDDMLISIKDKLTKAETVATNNVKVVQVPYSTVEIIIKNIDLFLEPSEDLEYVVTKTEVQELSKPYNENSDVKKWVDKYCPQAMVS